MRKYIVLLTAMMVAVGAVMAFSAFGAGAPAPKVDVCHINGNGVYNLINVSDNAVPAHLAHGDGLPGGVVGDKYFGADCSLISRTCVNGSGVFEDGSTTVTVNACLLPVVSGTARWVRTTNFANDMSGPVVAANINPVTGYFDVTIQIASSTNYSTWINDQIKFAITPGTPGSITWTWLTGSNAPSSATAPIITTGFTIS